MKLLKSTRRSGFTPTIHHIWLVLPLVISFVALNLTPLKEGDLWWQLKIGEQILQAKQFLLFDSFSFTAPGETFYFTYNGLSAVLLYLLEKTGGLSALVLIQALTSTCTVWLMFHEARKRAIQVTLAAIVTIIAWVGLYPFSSTRPQIFSFLFFAILYTLLSDYLLRRVNRLWLLPVLMLVWVNTHSGWWLGMICWLIMLSTTIILRWWKPAETPPVLPLLSWGLAMILILPLNPNGFTTLQSVFVTLGGNGVSTKFVSEWQPLLITNPVSWAFYGLFFLWVVALAMTRRATSFQELVLMVTFALLTMRSMRMVPFFYVLAAPIVSETLASLDWALLAKKLSTIQINRKNQPMRTAKRHPLPVRALNWAFMFIFAMGAILSLPPVHLSLRNASSDSLISQYFPVEAVSRLAEQPSRVYSLAEWGGYLTWRLYPPTTIFVDGRIPMYPISVWDDYLTIALAEPGWDTLIGEYKIDTLVLSKERHGAIILAARQAGWQVAAEDNASLILMQSINSLEEQP